MLSELIPVCHWMNQQGWSPATSGNYSCRDEENSFYISASGVDKGRIQPQQFLKYNLQMELLEPTSYKPSDETAIHAQVYRLSSQAGCVLHAHSIETTVLTMLSNQESLVLKDYELLKAIQGFDTHERELIIPIFENSQDMNFLAEKLKKQWNSEYQALLLRGHGIYVWGDTIFDAKRHVEAIHFMLKCELEKKRYQ